jgi:acetyltransferase-like isoleucine patch superfamily enzyme
MINPTPLNPNLSQAKVSKGAIVDWTSRIDPGCEISSETILKDHVTLCQNVTIIGRVTLEPSVNVRENVTLVGPLHIGKGTKIAHDVVIGLLREENDLADKETIIENYCRIGVGAEVIGGVHIGRQVLIRAGSKVIGDIPHYGLASRNPAILERYACAKCGGILKIYRNFREIVDTRCVNCGDDGLRFSKRTYFSSLRRVLLPKDSFGETVSTQGDDYRWIDDKEML